MTTDATPIPHLSTQTNTKNLPTDSQHIPTPIFHPLPLTSPNISVILQMRDVVSGVYGGVRRQASASTRTRAQSEWLDPWILVNRGGEVAREIAAHLGRARRTRAHRDLRK